ncbi:hypothetical protein EYZ11_006746 [Aspergillus tanneri]|uniref:Uncharacterized protein n=1 Tax=Aspergillus tanneri TaxID=1220188 RepID=A0A4S3JEP3_9EURO|nr:hypothetical protein EYZ11_006746 [Aspergillus tanneri]
MSPARDPRTGRFILTHENTEELSADPSAASSEDPVAIALPGEFLEEDSEPEEGRSPREDPVEVLRPEEDPGRQLEARPDKREQLEDTVQDLSGDTRMLGSSAEYI